MVSNCEHEHAPNEKQLYNKGCVADVQHVCSYKHM